jgi:hypothetical protein
LQVGHLLRSFAPPRVKPTRFTEYNKQHMLMMLHFNVLSIIAPKKPTTFGTTRSISASANAPTRVGSGGCQEGKAAEHALRRRALEKSNTSAMTSRRLTYAESRAVTGRNWEPQKQLKAPLSASIKVAYTPKNVKSKSAQQ